MLTHFVKRDKIRTNGKMEFWVSLKSMKLRDIKNGFSKVAPHMGERTFNVFHESLFDDISEKRIEYFSPFLVR